MKAQKLSATGAAQKPFANLHRALLSPLPAGEGKGEGGLNTELPHPGALTLGTASLETTPPLHEISVPICVSSVAKISVPLWQKRTIRPNSTKLNLIRPN